MFQENRQPSKLVKLRPIEQASGKLLSKRQNIAKPTFQQNKDHCTLTIGIDLLETSKVCRNSVKSTPKTVLPISRGPLKVRENCKDVEMTQHASPQKINLWCQKPAIQQKSSVPKSIMCQDDRQVSQQAHIRPVDPASVKLLSKRQNIAKPTLQQNKPKLSVQKSSSTTNGSDCKETLDVVVRERQYLTAYELEEVKQYEEVWYLGKRAFQLKIIKSNAYPNFGYDDTRGFYKAIIGDHLAYRYEIREVLGKGYSGQVFKCKDHKNKELVAIKVTRNTPSIHKLGEAEVKMLKDLRKADRENAANIVHMKSHFTFRNHLCITFELFEKDLNKAAKEKPRMRFSTEEIRKYAEDVLKCLDFLRKRKIIHGDLKPGNILLHNIKRTSSASVSDFGGSHYVKDSNAANIFTLDYASPEVLLGKKCCTGTDIWSLGCMLAELHCGKIFFQGSNHIDQFSCIMKVLGVPPVKLVMEAPSRRHYFDEKGVPLKILEIQQESSNLEAHLKPKDAYFLDFIERCLEYDPVKRITPAEALRHPWILKLGWTKPMHQMANNNKSLLLKEKSIRK